MEGHNEGETSHNGGHCRCVLQSQGGGTGHGHHHQNQGHQNCVDLDERVMGHIKLEALLLPVVLTHGISLSCCVTWTTFFEWYNLSENWRVRFAKMKLIGAQLFWECREIPY
jgi:hypothetical protein